MSIHPKSIVILDCGGQYAHLIGRRVRQAGAYSEILSPDTPAQEMANAAGIILSGGPQSVYEGGPQADKGIFDLGIPIFGICYGHQWVAQALGGHVEPGHTQEYGFAEVDVLRPEEMFKGLPAKIRVWMSHGDEVSVLPEGFVHVGKTDSCHNTMVMDPARKIFGVQFHPEVVHTQHGSEMIQNFVNLCKHAPWSVDNFTDYISDEIRNEVEEKNVFMLVSGGVDSTVAFALLNRVLGPERVQGLLVDTGLMRKGEVEAIGKSLNALGYTNLHIEDASAEFFANLENVYDPEQKRRIIGDTFLAVQKRVSESMGLDAVGSPSSGSEQLRWMLGQGTIYPDTIETGGTKHADHIKTHHNRVEAIEQMIKEGLVIEPLKELYKDEVRELGEEIGLPHDLVWRHPFPGPGLGVRILCSEGGAEVPSPALDIEHRVLPVQSVGVQGDGRTYRHAVSLFSADPYTVSDAYWSYATKIPNTQKTINRVLLCVSHATPQEFSPVKAYVSRERADLLREADAIVSEEMHSAGLYKDIWQFPVILLPVGIAGGQSIVLRPVESQEAMTASAAKLPPKVLERMTTRIMDLSGIDAVFYDLTSKPPGTIEWE